MSLRITSIYKAHQPGDVATFDAVESRHIVASGLARVETVDHAYEDALKDMHLTLPAAGIAGVGLGVARPSIADPTTRAAGAIPAGMRPAAATGSTVVDSRAGQPALERVSTTPNAAPEMDRLQTDPSEAKDPDPDVSERDATRTVAPKSETKTETGT